MKIYLKFSSIILKKESVKSSRVLFLLYIRRTMRDLLLFHKKKPFSISWKIFYYIEESVLRKVFFYYIEEGLYESFLSYMEEDLLFFSITWNKFYL